MTTIHISQDEAKRDLNAVLARLNEDTIVLIEDGSRPVAMLQLPPRPELSFAEKLERLRMREVYPDDTFAEDLDAAIASRREAFDPSVLD